MIGARTLRALCIVRVYAAALMAGGTCCPRPRRTPGRRVRRSSPRPRRESKKKEPASEGGQSRRSGLRSPPRKKTPPSSPASRTRGSGAIWIRRSRVCCRRRADRGWRFPAAGSDGAYGAGVLTGWTEAGNATRIRGRDRVQHRLADRPVRIPRAALRRGIRKNFTTIAAADIFEDRVTRDSLFDHWPLKRINRASA